MKKIIHINHNFAQYGCPQCGSRNIKSKRTLFSRKQYMKCNKCGIEWFPGNNSRN